MSVFSILQAKFFFDSEAGSSAGAAQTVQVLLQHMMAFIPHNSISLGHQRLGFVVPHIIWVLPMDPSQKRLCMAVRGSFSSLQQPSCTPAACFVQIMDVPVEVNVQLQAARTLDRPASDARAVSASCHKYSIH